MKTNPDTSTWSVGKNEYLTLLENAKHLYKLMESLSPNIFFKRGNILFNNRLDSSSRRLVHLNRKGLTKGNGSD